jgi:hypothetical protein
MITAIPVERLVNANRKLTEQELRREFLLQTYDEVEVRFDDERFEAFRARRAERMNNG